MNSHVKIPYRLIICTMIGLLASLGLGTVESRAGEILTYSSASFKEISIRRTSDGHQPLVEQRPAFGDLTASGSGNGDFACVGTATYFPDGSRVLNLSATLFDDNPFWNAAVGLRRRRINTSPTMESELMAEVATIDEPGLITLTTSTISDPVIDNSSYVYFLSATSPCLRGDQRLQGVKLEIEIESGIFSDGFESGDTSEWSSASL